MPDPGGDGYTNGENVVKLLREQITACLGKVLKWHFPDRESGLGGTIEMEVFLWITPLASCTDTAILKSGGPKLKCVGTP